jgi:hypothetical protein
VIVVTKVVVTKEVVVIVTMDVSEKSRKTRGGKTLEAKAPDEARRLPVKVVETVSISVVTMVVGMVVTMVVGTVVTTVVGTVVTTSGRGYTRWSEKLIPQTRGAQLFLP